MVSLFLTLLAVLAPLVDRPVADPNAPVVIGLHGRGDTPENFSHVADGLGPQFHWVFPRGPLLWKADMQGSQWFDRQTPDGGAAALRTAMALVEAEVQKAGKKPVALVGFSQGCMLAAHFVATHPDQVRAVLCFGGMLLAPVRVPAGKHAVEVRFIHGHADPMVPFAKGEEAVATLQKAGLNATLTPHDGGHVIPQVLVPQLRAWLTQKLK